jgi:hypothetical protein
VLDSIVSPAVELRDADPASASSRLIGCEVLAVVRCRCAKNGVSPASETRRSYPEA